MALSSWIGQWGPVNKLYFSTAVPSANDGTIYQVGDWIINTAPTGSNPPGWVCTATGNGATATFKTMANLGA